AESPMRPSAWWGERQLVARQLLATGNADTAYKLAQQHGLTDGSSYTEAEFLTGYIALRYRKDLALALDHFTRIMDRAVTPYGKARAAYWSGRAAEAAGDAASAAKWYSAGAEHMATFYGQLAAHQLGKDAPPRPVPEPQPNAAEQKHFDNEELVRAAKHLFAAGDREHSRNFIMQLADAAKTPVDFAMLASLTEAQGRIDLAISVAKRSIEAGTPLMVHGYPVTPLPSGGTAERSLLFAIVRQESGFATEAMSRVGARGLMQLMPATAAGLASKLQLPYSVDRLTGDSVYNRTLGRSYIETMIDEFGGSYPLAIAAYNAGPGRVRQWLREFGHPRGRDISMVDWIEMIPFNETRLYVHRVLENLQIYRGQDTNNVAAFSLASDLARRGTRYFPGGDAARDAVHKQPSSALTGSSVSDLNYTVELVPPDIEPYRAGNTGIEYVTTFEAKEPGPHVVVTALTHGNEICGAIALDRLFRAEVRPRRGRLSLAFNNVAAYHEFDPRYPIASRYVDEDFN